MCGRWKKLFSFWASVFPFVLASIAFAQSNPPFPTPTKHSDQQKTRTTKSNEQRQEEQRGTKDRPLIVEILQPPIDPKHAEQKPQEREAKSTQDKTVEIILAATSTISAFTVAIFTVFLHRTAKKQWKATSIAANAAERSAEAAHKTLAVAQRAFVFLKNINHAVHVRSGPNEMVEVIEHCSFWADIENVGFTPATHVESWMAYETVPRSISTVPTFPRSNHEDPIYTALGPRVTYGTVSALIPHNKIMECWNNKIWIYLYARVEYRDIFDPEIIHHHEQCVNLEIVHNPSGPIHRQNTTDTKWFRYRVCGAQNTTG